MSETLKILTIQDLSCYGQCSITVALPIISAFEIETAVIPSSVLSTHTSGFSDYTVRDLTHDLPGIREHWEKEGIYFDAIYTGYIGSVEQFKYIKEINSIFISRYIFLIITPCNIGIICKQIIKVFLYL